jgi:1-deoxy-D-xylulose-5-phosphate synthase
VDYLCLLPGFVVMVAADEVELMHMIATAARIDDRPSAVLYPCGNGIGLALPERGKPLEIGEGESFNGERVLLFSASALV